MSRIIMLDAAPLSLASQNPGKPDAARCIAWIESLKRAGCEIVIPEIARYEVRRELARVKSVAGLRRLDDLHPSSRLLPISGAVMDIASDLWAHVRRAGMPTAPDLALDGDAILAAQALVAAETGDQVIIATTNVAHLIRFPDIDARLWWTIV